MFVIVLVVYAQCQGGVCITVTGDALFLKMKFEIAIFPNLRQYLFSIYSVLPFLAFWRRVINFFDSACVRGMGHHACLDTGLSFILHRAIIRNNVDSVNLPTRRLHGIQGNRLSVKCICFIQMNLMLETTDPLPFWLRERRVNISIVQYSSQTIFECKATHSI